MKRSMAFSGECGNVYSPPPPPPPMYQWQTKEVILSKFSLVKRGVYLGSLKEPGWVVTYRIHDLKAPARLQSSTSAWATVYESWIPRAPCWTWAGSCMDDSLLRLFTAYVTGEEPLYHNFLGFMNFQSFISFLSLMILNPLSEGMSQFRGNN